jgi:hypothetical protein
MFLLLLLLLLLHKSGCFLDLRPEHFPNSKVAVQQRQQVEEVQEVQEVEQIVVVGESKKRVGGARKCKELQEKRARLETYAQHFDQRYVANTFDFPFSMSTIQVSGWWPGSRQHLAAEGRGREAGAAARQHRRLPQHGQQHLGAAEGAEGQVQSAQRVADGPK